MTGALLLLSLLGCVPKGKHEITTVQLSATRTALSAQVQRCAADQNATDEQIAALETEIALRQAQLDEIAARNLLHEEHDAELNREITAALAELDAVRAERDRLLTLVPKRSLPKEGTEVPPVVDEGLAATVAAALQVQHERRVDEIRVAERHAEVVAAFQPLVEQGRAEVEARGRGTIVRIRTSLLFQEGFTTLSPRGATIVAEAAEALSTLPGRWVVVEGYTDDRPVHTAEWSSNWERGFSRAVAVLRALEASGVTQPLSAASYADTRPVVPNDAPDAADLNDRVQLFVRTDPGLLDAFAPTPPEPEPDAPAPEEPTQPEP
ncbi:MAG: OmpA family protein [Alphaproteobacteria bacterium]|nr:OmpA family protein [Alphaproteobacteria bacterium]